MSTRSKMTEQDNEKMKDLLGKYEQLKQTVQNKFNEYDVQSKFNEVDQAQDRQFGRDEMLSIKTEIEKGLSQMNQIYDTLVVMPMSLEDRQYLESQKSFYDNAGAKYQQAIDAKMIETHEIEVKVNDKDGKKKGITIDYVNDEDADDNLSQAGSISSISSLKSKLDEVEAENQKLRSQHEIEMLKMEHKLKMLEYEHNAKYASVFFRDFFEFSNVYGKFKIREIGNFVVTQSELDILA